MEVHALCIDFMIVVMTVPKMSRFPTKMQLLKEPNQKSLGALFSSIAIISLIHNSWKESFTQKWETSIKFDHFLAALNGLTNSLA